MAKGDLVYIESPYAESESGSVEDHVEYTRLCMIDCIKRGEFPFVSHLLYPQVLDDLDASERRQGMQSGKVWGALADLRVVYTDQGESKGMTWGIKHAVGLGQRVEYRSLRDEESDADCP
ncbi:hypothetical protein LCGC14_0483890 [marine sediment metagenome]|uniref:DUF7768 domain-containing protein n=1 Tax=marine sediment metagenome TaxID=412755 RepID=A0A0F9VHD6_9ZZZZ